MKVSFRDSLFRYVTCHFKGVPGGVDFGEELISSPVLQNVDYDRKETISLNLYCFVVQSYPFRDHLSSKKNVFCRN